MSRVKALTDGKYQYTIELDALDDASLQKYAGEAGADYSRLTNTDDPAAIVIDTVKYKDQETDKYVETKNVKLNKGEKLELYCQNPENDEKTELKQIKVEALTGILPMGIMSLGKSPSFHVIISKAVLQKLIEGKDESASGDLVTQVFYSSSDPMKLQENLEVIQNEVGASKLNIFNLYKNRQGEEQVLLLVSVFTYAFIILITAICIANIINTISTSIALRKREFAMLKSVGITPNGFNKMLNYESIFYGIKSIMYGLPISIGVMYLMHRVLRSVFEFPFTVPIKDVIIVVASVFVIVGTAMLYSSTKVRKENIIDALKQEIV
jgi:putative ABC transport system permease protein